MSETNPKRAVMGGPKGKPRAEAKMQKVFTNRDEEISRLTVNLPVSVHTKLKRAALNRRTSMTEMLIEFIETLDD